MQGLWNTVCVDTAQAIYNSSSSSRGSVILSSLQGWSTHTWNDQYDACYYTDCLTIWIKQKSCFVFAQMVALAGGAAFFYFPILLLLLKTKIRFFIFFFFCTNYSNRNRCVVICNYETSQKRAVLRGWSMYSVRLHEHPFGRVGENRCQWKSSLRSLDSIAIGLLHNNCTMTSWNQQLCFGSAQTFFSVHWFNQILIVLCLNSTRLVLSSGSLAAFRSSKHSFKTCISFPLHRHITTNNFRTL